MKAYRTTCSGAEFKVQRLQDAPQGAQSKVLDTPERAVEHIRPMLGESLRFSGDVENLGVIWLNTRRKVIGWEIVSNGLLDTILVHAREVFRSAIVMNAAAIILFHNHPSGDPTPSEADIKVTRDLIKAGNYTAQEWLEKTGHDPRHFPCWFYVSPGNQFCTMTPEGKQTLAAHFDAVRRNWNALGIAS